METSTRGKQSRQREKKLTCRVPWEVQRNTEQMENHDEKTMERKRRNKDNEMRNVNNGRGQPSRHIINPVTPLMRLIGFLSWLLFVLRQTLSLITLAVQDNWISDFKAMHITLKGCECIPTTLPYPHSDLHPKSPNPTHTHQSLLLGAHTSPQLDPEGLRDVMHGKDRSYCLCVDACVFHLL